MQKQCKMFLPHIIASNYVKFNMGELMSTCKTVLTDQCWFRNSERWESSFKGFSNAAGTILYSTSKLGHRSETTLLSSASCRSITKGGRYRGNVSRYFIEEHIWKMFCEKLFARVIGFTVSPTFLLQNEKYTTHDTHRIHLTIIKYRWNGHLKEKTEP